MLVRRIPERFRTAKLPARFWGTSAARKITRARVLLKAHPGILGTLALAYFTTGRTPKAIETQQKAVSLLPPGESPLRTELEANLAKYRQSAKNKAPDQGKTAPANRGDQSDPPADREAGSTGP